MQYSWVIWTRSDEVPALPPPSVRTIPSQAICYLSAQSLSRVRLSVTPWTVAHQAPLSMEFSRQEYWSGLPCSPPGDLLDTGTKPGSSTSPESQADSLPTERPGKPPAYMLLNY